MDLEIASRRDQIETLFTFLKSSHGKFENLLQMFKSSLEEEPAERCKSMESLLPIVKAAEKEIIAYCNANEHSAPSPGPPSSPSRPKGHPRTTSIEKLSSSSSSYQDAVLINHTENLPPSPRAVQDDPDAVTTTQGILKEMDAAHTAEAVEKILKNLMSMSMSSVPEELRSIIKNLKDITNGVVNIDDELLPQIRESAPLH